MAERQLGAMRLSAISGSAGGGTERPIELPRIREIREGLRNPKSPNAYFQDFDGSILEEPVTRGGRSTLNWTSNNAVGVELNGTAMNLNGTQVVNPVSSTDYQMTARAADGRTANASVHVSVSTPPPPSPPPPPPAAPMRSAAQVFTENVRDSFFDFDKYNIRADAQQSLIADA